MPGLNQLKQFSTDLLNLGDEPKIRAARGEKLAVYPIPATVEDRDDSEDFALGLPGVDDENLAQMDAAAAAAKQKEASDSSDLLGNAKDLPPEDDSGEPYESNLPNLDDLLASIANGGNSSDEIDLSEFEEPAKKEPEKPKEVPIEDLDFDSLLAPSPKPAETKSEPASIDDMLPPELQSALNSVKAPEPAEPVQASKPVQSDEIDPSFFGVDFGDSDEQKKTTGTAQASPVTQATPAATDFNMPQTSPSSADTGISDNFNLPDTDSGSFDAGNFNLSDGNGTFDAGSFNLTDSGNGTFDASNFNLTDNGTGTFDASSLNLTGTSSDSADNIEELGELDELEELTDFDMPDDSLKPTAQVSDISADSFDLPQTDFDAAPVTDTSSNAQTNAPAGNDFTFEDISFDDIPDDASAASSSSNASANTSTEIDINSFDSVPSSAEPTTADLFDTSALDSMPDFGSNSDAGSNASDDFSFTDFSAPSGEIDISATDSVPNEEFTPEAFDTSDIENMSFGDGDVSTDDFSGTETDTDFALGNFGSSDDAGGFNIPGFSDTVTADLNKSKQKLSTPDFSGAHIQAGKPKNTFTDAEYKRFEKNLSDYPLNVRLALEDLVVKNEFTDDAVFGILEKVLRKVPARQLASELEKMLDITLEVPRDYERRTAEEYEAYKKSVEYKLKNKIIPGAILTTFAAAFIFCIFVIFGTFVYIPIKANHYYKKGWNCLEKEEFPQAAMEFDTAISYKPVKKWFFKYAEGYRTHKQYERSISMYKAILQRFNHEKQAGLDWADMELYDRFNYEETERIIKREVLDYHINDKDAILLLGDDYLEWATEKDSSKFSDALAQYGLLLQLYGSDPDNVYYSRMMRYYIRTDNLQQVLNFKNGFYPSGKSPKKNPISARDLTELSGYLLDKRYGTLSQTEEHLRFQIEDVRNLLERAVKANQENPEALYNFGRYFIETSNDASALPLLEAALTAFENQQFRTKREAYKFINTYRLIGELYKHNRQYTPAEEYFIKGIQMYENENESSGFESDQNIGKLYENLGDLNYFLSGNLDYAKANYINAVNNKNDIASVRYKIGYIQYVNKEYTDALGSFIKATDSNSSDSHLLLALANTLSLRNDNYAAQGYYEKLLMILNKEKELHSVLLPQVREDQYDLVDSYMKASNNLGVTLNRIAMATGNSKMNAEAIYRFTESIRAWDAISRNQDTMERKKEPTLPQLNIKYIDHPTSTYSPEIFTEISRTLIGEKGLD